MRRLQGARPVTESVPVFDVVIAGGAASGLALAAAVKQALGAGVAIAVVDPAPPPAPDAGASAPAHGRDRRGAAAASRKRRRLGGDRAEGASHPRRWRSWTGTCATRCGSPICISTPRATAPLAHMAFNDDVVAALSALCDRLGVERIAGVGRALDARQARRRACARRRPRASRPPRRRRRRRALEAARARRRSRPTAGTTTSPASSPPSRTSAITKACAEQHFLPAGPFAILPLPGRQSSIVWNERRADARALARARAGRLLAPARTPLHAEARRDPPRLAGRSLSVPLPDRAPLRRRAARARRRRRACRPSDRRPGPQPRPARRRGARRRRSSARCGSASIPARPAPLAAYQRARRFDVAASGMGMDAMNRLFSNDFGPLRFAARPRPQRSSTAPRR